MDHFLLNLAEGFNGYQAALCVASLAALYCLYTCIKHLLLLYRMQDFATTEGLVRKSRVGSRKVYRNNRTRIEYYPELEYEFQVNGQRFTGSTMSFHTNLTSYVDEYTGMVQDKFPRGSRPTVYYNPNNPSECCLIANRLGMKFILFVLGAIASLGACIALPLILWNTLT